MSDSPEPVTDHVEGISRMLAVSTIIPLVAHTSTQTTKSTTLPLELREKIYEHALRDAGLFSNPKPRLPPVCCTSKTEYLASAKVLLRNASVTLYADGDAESWQRWIATMPGVQNYSLPAYKNVHLHYNSTERKGSLTKDFQLLSSFTFLREVNITIIHGWEPLLSEHIYQRYHPHARYMDAIWSETHKFIEKTQILELRACASLERVIFHTSWVHAMLEAEHIPMLADKIAVRIKRDYIRAHGRILQVVFVVKIAGGLPIETPIGRISDKWAARLAKP